jgi:hypothetical protein
MSLNDKQIHNLTRTSSSGHDFGVVCPSSEENADCFRLLHAFAAVPVMLDDSNHPFVGDHDNGCR